MERKQYQGIVENSRTWWTYCCLSIFCEPITVRVRYFMRLGFRIEIGIYSASHENPSRQVTCHKSRNFKPFIKRITLGKN